MSASRFLHAGLRTRHGDSGFPYRSERATARSSTADASSPTPDMELKPGDPAPDFTLTADDGSQVTLSGLRGKKVVLFFYGKDFTPG